MVAARHTSKKFANKHVIFAIYTLQMIYHACCIIYDTVCSYGLFSRRQQRYVSSRKNKSDGKIYCLHELYFFFGTIIGTICKENASSVNHEDSVRPATSKELITTEATNNLEQEEGFLHNENCRLLTKKRQVANTKECIYLYLSIYLLPNLSHCTSFYFESLVPCT